MTWRQYINNSLMCDVTLFYEYRNESGLKGKHLTAAAIVGQDGTVWAQNSEFPLFRHGEVTNIMKELDRPGSVGSINIGGNRYELVGGENHKVVRGERGTGGVTIMKTNEALIIGIFDEPLSLDMCNTIVESLGCYFIDTLLM